MQSFLHGMSFVLEFLLVSHYSVVTGKYRLKLSCVCRLDLNELCLFLKQGVIQLMEKLDYDNASFRIGETQVKKQLIYFLLLV